jgi:hypothetical protein
MPEFSDGLTLTRQISASEALLGKDWLRTEEDEAWQNL